jgi:hypothetical protein
MALRSTNLTIGNYPFVCVPLSDADFSDVAAVYVIICVGDNGSWRVLDVGQTGELGNRIDSHERRACWEKNCQGQNIWVCVYQMLSNEYTETDRLDVEKQIRNAYGSIPCGKR